MTRNEMVERIRTLLERIDNFEPEDDSVPMLLAHIENELNVIVGALTDESEGGR